MHKDRRTNEETVVVQVKDNQVSPQRMQEGQGPKGETSVRQIQWPTSLCVVGHDGEEFLFVDLAILVKVKFVYHCLPVGVCWTRQLYILQLHTWVGCR